MMMGSLGFAGVGWGVRRGLAMKLNGSRPSPKARSKPNGRVRTTPVRKALSTTGGSGGRGSKAAAAAAEEEEDKAMEGREDERMMLSEILEECRKLLFYRRVVEDEVVESLLMVLEALELFGDNDEDDNGDESAIMEAYRDYFCALAEAGTSWPDKFLSLVLYSDNVFSNSAQKKPLDELPDALLSAAGHDLSILQKLFRFDPQTIANLVNSRFSNKASVLPMWTVDASKREEFHKRLDRKEYELRAAFESNEKWSELLQPLHGMYRGRGCGQFAEHNFFLWDSDLAELKPVTSQDDVVLEDIYGTRRQKKVFRQNLEFLFAGLRAQNILLTGPRGTGKSALAKAFVNSNAHRGLRLIEIDSLLDIESFRALFVQLKDRAEKFVLFVDDFNFDVDEEEYRCMRKLLDGSGLKIPQNVILCVTSSRYTDSQGRVTAGLASSDTEAEDIYFEEDIFGLCDRFGTILGLEESTRERYLDMVKHLAERAGISDIGSGKHFRSHVCQSL